ncbi:ammonia-dependent NAD(+) synthetase [Paenibacillus montanisoli]|uniref:NH(3)-dependent NAD(+) synthetase n=1 Tax=Paenibacillus montanisoli TaxID=2081970 RepID=A0A328TUU1_9BACL|nr:ammonia-dependent NAD(+) synthetase [Paenibacillus montanisoli]RAP74318.1 NAD(+) synthase [Paenibacillus montanisoli]
MDDLMQKRIIAELKVKPAIDAGEEIRRRVDFMKAYMQHTRSKGFVLGISGGQDSTLAGKLAQLAVNEWNAEHDESNRAMFVAVRLPYGVQRDEDDCQDALRFIEPTRTVTINIKASVDASVAAFEEATGEKLGDFHKGNVKARERMKAQYDLAAHYGLLVLGTDHAAEAVTGFYTKHGDGACDLVPIYGLNKRQGRSMLIELGCPEHLYTKKPTADLEDLKPGIPDEEALGMSYVQLDDYLEGQTVPAELSGKIEARYKLTEHKRRGPVTVYDDWWKE